MIPGSTMPDLALQRCVSAGSDPAAPAGEQAMLSSRSESRSRWCDLEESHELYQRRRRASLTDSDSESVPVPRRVA